MNRFNELPERKAATELIIEAITQSLKMGYNPYYKKIVLQRNAKYDIGGDTLFIPALKKSLERIKVSDDYRKHFKGYIIPNVEKAAIHLGYHVLFISEVKRKHIIYILDHLAEVNERFTDNTFNMFRKDLKILFKELVSVEAIENNPIDENLPVKQVEQKERIVLSDAERVYINNLLCEKYPSFHRFLHIFFHSGARESELMRIKGCDVDLKGQRFRVTIKKGKKSRIVWKVIKTIALPYWSELMKDCGNDDYVFSRGLVPGSEKIRPDQITKRWYRLVKSREHEINGVKTKIEATFYSLKHSHSTEISGMISQEAAAEVNSHTSIQMVKKVYDLNSEHRQSEKIKRLNNKFA
jgi:integrase